MRCAVCGSHSTSWMSAGGARLRAARPDRNLAYCCALNPVIWEEATCTKQPVATEVSRNRGQPQACAGVAEMLSADADTCAAQNGSYQCHPHCSASARQYGSCLNLLVMADVQLRAAVTPVLTHLQECVAELCVVQVELANGKDGVADLDALHGWHALKHPAIHCNSNTQQTTPGASAHSMSTPTSQEYGCVGCSLKPYFAAISST